MDDGRGGTAVGRKHANVRHIPITIIIIIIISTEEYYYCDNGTRNTATGTGTAAIKSSRPSSMVQPF
jgi:hypothetical protein